MSVKLSSLIARTAVPHSAPVYVGGGGGGIRQTVLSGPVDSNGHADFLEVGTGLQVVSKNLDTSPLQVTFGQGFENSIPSDKVSTINNNLTWDNLEDNTVNFLYLEMNGSGGVTTGSGILPPEYAYIKPASPSSGQFFYPTTHLEKGSVWNGSSWVPTLRLYVGECVTSSGVVTDVVSYAYNGRMYVKDVTMPRSSSAVINHNIGTELIEVENYLVFINDLDGYSVGNRIHTTTSPLGSAGLRINYAVLDRKAFCISNEDTRVRFVRLSGGDSDARDLNNFVYEGFFTRSF